MPDLDLLARCASATLSDGDSWMDAAAAAKHLAVSLNALHKLTAARLIPFHQEGPRCKLWFRRSELDAWLESGGSRVWLAEGPG